MKVHNVLTSAALAACLSLSASGCAADNKAVKVTPGTEKVDVKHSGMAVKITADMEKVDVKHGGATVSIMRNQDVNATVNPAFAKTSRECPPFCIQPGTIAPGVETIGEVEVIHYIKKLSDGDKSILVVDSRTPDWVAKGTIPGAVNIPWTSLKEGKDGADAFTINDVLVNSFGATEKGQGYDFGTAKTLVMFCNGMWCGQSPTNIKTLLKMGYPAEKIKWYRGGMQDWNTLGLTTVAPAN